MKPHSEQITYKELNIYLNYCKLPFSLNETRVFFHKQKQVAKPLEVNINVNSDYWWHITYNIA